MTDGQYLQICKFLQLKEQKEGRHLVPGPEVERLRSALLRSQQVVPAQQAKAVGGRSICLVGGQKRLCVYVPVKVNRVSILYARRGPRSIFNLVALLQVKL